MQMTQKGNTKADRKLMKLIGQNIGDSKKSTHYALNKILKDIKRKK